MHPTDPVPSRSPILGPPVTEAETRLANAISEAIIQHFGYVPLHVRYGAANSAINRLRMELPLYVEPISDGMV